jgi:tetratricopeptide (TPR) repeat protein
MKKNLILALGAGVTILIIAVPFVFFLSRHISQKKIDAENKQFASYFQQANALFEQGDYKEAVAYYFKAIKEKPDAAQTYFNCGLSLEKLSQPAEAISLYKQAIKYNAQYANAYFHIAGILKNHKNHASALMVIDEYLKQNPQDEKALLVKASIVYDQGDLETAQALCIAIITHNPRLANAFIMLGNVYEKLNKIPESVAAYKKAVELDPANPKAHTALSDGYLAMGDYPQWGKEYEWRWRMDLFKHKFAPIWDGSNLHGKTILLIPENGLGDTLQYVRFIPRLKEQGAHIVMLVQKPLASYLRATCPFIDRVITERSQIPAIDYMTSVMSLPYHFNITQKTLGTTPYLKADAALTVHWKKQMALDKNFKIGICWHASPIDAQYSIPQSRRTMTLETIAQLANAKNVSLYSLQKGWPVEELKKYGIKDFGADFDVSHGAFMDTAAIMKNLDLIITIDTVTAHLAGGLNVPVWVMLPVAADVRWMLHRPDTPWYASMKFFRQTKTEDWQTVVHNVQNELEKKVIAWRATKAKTVAA